MTTQTLSPAVILPRARRVPSPKTNSIGPGTCNAPLNIPIREKELLAKAASARGESFNAFAKALMLIGLQSISPELAKEITEARRQLKSSALLLLVGYMTITSWVSGGDLEMRRPKGGKNVRIIRTVKRGKDTDIA